MLLVKKVENRNDVDRIKTIVQYNKYNTVLG